MAHQPNRVSFQGAHGAYSDMAARTLFPEAETLPCPDFAATILAVHEGDAELAIVPVDNSIAGRVADIHHLLPESNLHIIGETFQPIHHCLLGIKGATLDRLQVVHSHIHALPQCRHVLKQYGLVPHVHSDTAGAAKEIALRGERQHGAIASALAAEIYGLNILKENIQDHGHNTTRFLVLSPDPVLPQQNGQDLITTFVFRVRNIPAALYKAMGGFATNGINMTKLESYMVDGHFSAAQFYCDVEGHPENGLLKLALEELDFFAKEVKVLGTYPAHPFRKEQNGGA